MKEGFPETIARCMHMDIFLGRRPVTHLILEAILAWNLDFFPDSGFLVSGGWEPVSCCSVSQSLRV